MLLGKTKFYHFIKLMKKRKIQILHWIKNARSRFLLTRILSYKDNLRSCPYMGEYGSLQTRILAYNLLCTDGSVTVLSNVSQTYKKCLHKQMYFHFNRLFFNPLKAWWEGGSIRSSLWFFLKCIFQREREDEERAFCDF